MSGRIDAQAAVRRDEDLAVFDPDLSGGHVVGPQIEGAAARQVEARVMPGAGENAVPDAALVQRKSEMRAAVVQREHAALIVHHEHGATPALDDHAPLGCEFGERADVNEPIRLRPHDPRLTCSGLSSCSRSGWADCPGRSPP